MPKQPTCQVCGHKLMKVTTPTKNGRSDFYAHKKKEHWADRPHSARPVFEEV